MFDMFMQEWLTQRVCVSTSMSASFGFNLLGIKVFLIMNGMKEGRVSFCLVHSLQQTQGLSLITHPGKVLIWP